MPTESTLLDALKSVVDDHTGKDVVSAKQIKGLKVEPSGRVAFTFELGYPAKSQHAAWRQRLGDALRQVPGVTDVAVEVKTQITAHAVQRGVQLLPGVKNIIAVASGKGGVGKSTVAVNLALALAHRGARVGLCDIDIYGPSVPVLLGVAKAKPGVSADQKRFLPVSAYGLKVMSIGFLVDDDTPVIWRGPIVSSVVKQFLDDVEWGHLDYLILDLPPGTGDAQLTLTQSAPITGAIIVTTPSELALVDAVKGLQMFRKVETPVLGIVENMSHYVCAQCGHHSVPFNSGGTARVAEQLGTRILANIPLSDEVQRGGDSGHPVVAETPDAPQSQAFFQLADALIEKLPFEPAPAVEEKKKGFFAGLFRK